MAEETETTTAEPTVTAKVENGSSDLASLKKKIIRQVEFYFGDFNLMRDKFMKEKIREDEGWFSMDTMLKFKRLSTICSEPSTILEALQGSDLGLLEIDAENNRIRRKPNRAVSEDNEEYRAKLKARTVHVSGFQSDENIDDLHEFISEYGKLEGIQLLRTPDKKFKGSLFATFFNKVDAERLVIAPMVYYKCNELKKMFKSEFYKQLEEEKTAKKRKASEEKKEPNELKGVVYLKVSSITDDTIIHIDVKQVFESKDVHTIRFFDRTEPMGSEGYLVLEDQRTPEELLKILEDNGGTKVTIKSAEVEFSKPTDEEKVKIDKWYIEARQKFFAPRGKNRNQKHGKWQGRQQHKKKSPHKPKGKKTTFDSDDDNEEKKESVEEKVEPAAKVAKTDE